MNTIITKLYLNKGKPNIVARVEAWEKRDGKGYTLYSVLDLNSITDWVTGAALEDNQFPELYPIGPFDTLAEAAEALKWERRSKVEPTPKIRITLVHEYTPNVLSYPPGSTPEQMLEIDRRDDGPMEIMESAMADGKVTVQMEVVRGE